MPTKEEIDAKCQEISLSPAIFAARATNVVAQRRFAVLLLQGNMLDMSQPYESYIILEPPNGKDEQRIYDIVKKANMNQAGCVGMISLNVSKMIDLAVQMNHLITNEDKRARRRAACLKYGLKFLAKCFEKRI